MNKERLIPLIVATALFMENMDSTVIATSLPAIAVDIGTSPLTLKLAITSYLLSLAVFIPASGWTADRFGARMVFSIAIGVFMIGSIGCALSQNVTHFVIARILQGMGGAMMTPVGRLVLLRSIDKSALVYVMHARRTGSPVLDFSLLRLSTMRASIIGGFLFRLGIGALPFLLPLLMQEGFGLTPFQSGLVTFASAVGAMGMKTLAARIIRAFGFRNMMTVNAVVSAVFLAACALFTVATPLMLIFIILVVGGFFRSLQFTAINTVAYAEVEPAQMSRATTLVSVNQQLAISAGVAVGAFSVESTMLYQHVTELSAAVFPPAFLVVAIISAVSAYFFWQMPDDAGHEISGRKAVEISSRKGAAKAAAKAASEGTEDARDQRLG